MERFIKNVAQGAGKILRGGFQTKFKIGTKSSIYDYVTEFDLAAEQFIIGKIKKRFPSHGIIGEETGQNGSKKSFWIIDPLDGTHAFVKGNPQFSTTFCFIYNNRIEYGVVYDPIHNELFYAQRGKGTTLNGKKISVSKTPELKFANFTSYVASRLGKAQGNKYRRFIYNKIITEYQMWNDTTSSVALGEAYIAAGRFDVLFSKGLNPWDNAAGALLIQEAGGKISDSKGKPYHWKSDELLVANPILHREVLKLFKKL